MLSNPLIYGLNSLGFDTQNKETTTDEVKKITAYLAENNIIDKLAIEDNSFVNDIVNLYNTSYLNSSLKHDLSYTPGEVKGRVILHAFPRKIVEFHYELLSVNTSYKYKSSEKQKEYETAVKILVLCEEFCIPITTKHCNKDEQIQDYVNYLKINKGMAAHIRNENHSIVSHREPSITKPTAIVTASKVRLQNL